MNEQIKQLQAQKEQHLRHARALRAEADHYSRQAQDLDNQINQWVWGRAVERVLPGDGDSLPDGAELGAGGE